MSRLFYISGFILCVFFCAFAFYLEYVLEQMPCLLCQLQRILIVGMGLIFLIATIHNPKQLGRAFYCILLLIIGLSGLLLASRQLWLIAHPPVDTYSQCSANLRYLIEILPLDQVLRMVIQGGADCAKVSWSFLSLTLPAWSLIAFSLLLIVNFVAAVRQGKR